MVLGWVGNLVYQHAAIVRSASAPDTLGLGILRPVFDIQKPWLGAQIECDNMLRGRVHPVSVSTQAALRRREVSLSQDQLQCLEKINESTNPHLSIQAYAGTGKTFLLSLLVEAALKAAEEWGGAVAIVTPSRRLRDASLQGPDFMGGIFEGSGYGSRVSLAWPPFRGPWVPLFLGRKGCGDRGREALGSAQQG